MRDRPTQLPTEDGTRSGPGAVGGRGVLVGCGDPRRAAGEILTRIDWDGVRRRPDDGATAEQFLSLLD